MIKLFLSFTFLIATFFCITNVLSEETETTGNYLPNISEFTTSGGTATGSVRGCAIGKYCTAGIQGPGGTYKDSFDLEEKMTIDQINSGFTMDYGLDAESHSSNSYLSSCSGGNTLQNGDCRDVFNLTLSLFGSGNSLVHKFEHQVEFDFTGTRSYSYQQIIPENTYSSLTGEFSLFGIDAGYPSGYYGPRFSDVHLSTTYNIVNLIEENIIDILNPIDVPENTIPVVDIEIAPPLPPVAIAPIQEQDFSIPTEIAEIPEITVEPMEQSVETAAIEQDLDQQIEQSTQEVQQETQESEVRETSPEEPQEQQEVATEQQESSEETQEEQQTEEAPVETQVAESEQEAEQPSEVKSKPKIAAKIKQKLAKKIMSKVTNKSRYEASSQIRTLVVMNILSENKNFFKEQKLSQGIPGFFSTDSLPDNKIPSNTYAQYYMIGGSDQMHSAIVDSQYK
jgi:hypothetical protein